MTLVSFDSSEWKSKNEDHTNWTRASNSKLVIESGTRTDWWRTAIGSEPESQINRTTGPLRFIVVPSTKTHWKAGAWISGCFDERFKQATLFLGREGYDQQGVWAKAGIEVEDEEHNVGCVVAAPYSDWSISPLDTKIGRQAGESKLYIQFTRSQADVFVHYAVSDVNTNQNPPNKLQLLREIKGFAVLSSAATSTDWHVGVMVCGPLSNSTEGQWEDFTLEYL